MYIYIFLFVLLLLLLLLVRSQIGRGCMGPISDGAARGRVDVRHARFVVGFRKFKERGRENVLYLKNIIDAQQRIIEGLQHKLRSLELERVTPNSNCNGQQNSNPIAMAHDER